MRAVVKQIPVDTIVLPQSAIMEVGDIVEVTMSEVDSNDTEWFEVYHPNGNMNRCYIAHFTSESLSFLED